MDTRRLLKSISCAAAGITFIVSIGLNIFQYQQNKKLGDNFHELVSKNNVPTDEQAARRENAGQKTAALSKSGIASGREEVAELNYQLQATEEELDMVHKDLNKEMDRRAELAQQRRELQKQQFQSPTFLKVRRENTASQYADFFKAFNISPEDAEAFVDILIEEQNDSQEIYYDAEEIVSPTEDDREKFKQLFQSLNDDYEAKKKDILGEAAFEEIDSYWSRWYYEKYEVGGFSESLDSNEKLSSGQQAAMVDALVDAQETLREENAARNEEVRNTYTFPFEYYNEESLNRMIKNSTRRSEISVEAVRGILSPSQIGKLETYMDKELDRTITDMKMTGMDYYGYDYGQEDAAETQETGEK